MDKTYGRMARAEELVKGAHEWTKVNHGCYKFYAVPGSGSESYLVNTRSCNCQDYIQYQMPCKHVLSVRIYVKNLREDRRFAMGVAGRKGY